MGTWTKEEIAELRRLYREKRLFTVEIAQRLGRKPGSVTAKRIKLGIPSTQKTIRHRFGKWNSKHSHLREPAMRYFLKHSFEQTRKKFGLTQSELKSLMTVSYRDTRFKHLRKDTRRRDAWSTNELLFLLQHAGLKNRDWINKKLKRGRNSTVIKEKMQALGIASRNLQGLTLSQFRQVFGKEPELYLQTSAGPTRGGLIAPTLWKIVPWVWLLDQVKRKRLKVTTEFQVLIHSHAMFQNWIFGGRALQKMQRICNG